MSVCTSNTNVATSRRWLANLALTFQYSEYGTQLVRTQRSGPLLVQKPFYPEGRECAHIYLLHPPAGIVSGDNLKVSVHLQERSHVLITTPGGNRFYRAREDLSIGDPKQHQTTALEIESQAICENFPQETIVYEGADGVNTVDIYMSGESVYMGWDITCLGLPSSEQPFDQGRYTQLNRLFCDDTLIYHDRISLSPENQLLNHMAGLGKHSVFGTFLLYAPKRELASATLIEEVRQLVNEANAEHKISITNIDGLFVVRYLGAQAQECKTLFTQVWRVLRPHFIDKTGIEPRIWHT